MVIRKNKLTLGISIIAAGATAAAVFWWQHMPVGRVVSMTPPTSSTHREVAWNKTRETKDASSVQGKSASGIPARIELRQRMQSEKDWFAFAKQILPQAQAGDPEAQFVIFKTYRNCWGGEDHDIGTEQAAREFAMTYNIPVEQTVALFHKCHGFFTSAAASLGDPWSWLQRATDAGYAPAQAQTACERLLQDDLKAAVQAGSTPTDVTLHLPPIGGDVTPHELLAMAAQSGDPEAIGMVGDMQAWLNPTQPQNVVNINRSAWLYAACQRLGDCSGWGATTLINCGPNDGKCVPVPDPLLQAVDYNWAPVQEKIDQINAALGTKNWDQLSALVGGG
jgi:hypothetical protein